MDTRNLFAIAGAQFGRAGWTPIRHNEVYRSGLIGCFDQKVVKARLLSPIRVLILAPGLSRDPLVCRLSQTQCRQKKELACRSGLLSFAWRELPGDIEKVP